MKTSRGSSPNTGYYFSSQFCTSVLQDFSLQNKYEQITKTSVLKSKAVLTFKHTYLQTYYSWINHCAYFHLHLLGSRATVVDPVYSRLFQDFCNMCTRNQYLCLHFWHSLHLIQLFFEEFFDSICNVLTSKFFQFTGGTM